jgi:mono/diheme cytochrome c family protein
MREIYHKASWRLLSLLWLTLGAVALIAAGCAEPGQAPWRSTGSYPIDIFPEMHYNQSYKAQEPPRLAPPPDSVPVTGSELPLPALKADATSLQSSVSLPLSDTDRHRAAVLYQINCSMCHGKTSTGDGYVGQRFTVYPATTPPSFSSERIKALSPGEAYWSITNGSPPIPEGLPDDLPPETMAAFRMMPAFAKLLKSEDRWLLAHLINLGDADREALLDSTDAPGG